MSGGHSGPDPTPVSPSAGRPWAPVRRRWARKGRQGTRPGPPLWLPQAACLPAVHVRSSGAPAALSQVGGVHWVIHPSEPQSQHGLPTPLSSWGCLRALGLGPGVGSVTPATRQSLSSTCPSSGSRTPAPRGHPGFQLLGRAWGPRWTRRCAGETPRGSEGCGGRRTVEAVPQLWVPAWPLHLSCRRDSRFAGGCGSGAVICAPSLCLQGGCVTISTEVVASVHSGGPQSAEAFLPCARTAGVGVAWELHGGGAL